MSNYGHISPLPTLKPSKKLTSPKPKNQRYHFRHKSNIIQDKSTINKTLNVITPKVLNLTKLSFSLEEGTDIINRSSTGKNNNSNYYCLTSRSNKRPTLIKKIKQKEKLTIITDTIYDIKNNNNNNSSNNRQINTDYSKNCKRLNTAVINNKNDKISKTNDMKDISMRKRHYKTKSFVDEKNLTETNGEKYIKKNENKFNKLINSRKENNRKCNNNSNNKNGINFPKKLLAGGKETKKIKTLPHATELKKPKTNGTSNIKSNTNKNRNRNNNTHISSKEKKPLNSQKQKIISVKLKILPQTFSPHKKYNRTDKSQYKQKIKHSKKTNNNGNKAVIVPFKLKVKFSKMSSLPIMRIRPRTKSVSNNITSFKQRNYDTESNTDDKISLEHNQPKCKVLKIESYSIPGYLDKSHKKINQDNFFIENNFLGNNQQFLIGVCDGHGIYGHLCSEYIARYFPNKLSSYLQFPHSQFQINAIISKSFVLFDNELLGNKAIDTILSGSTLNTVLLLKDRLICANLGDSTAIICKYENGKYISSNLSRNHWPSEKDEAERIIKKGGEIHPYLNNKNNKESGPLRIWLKNSDVPGLAITRTLGDEVAHSIGVISEPEIREVQYEGNERFVVVASDGVWEFITREECVDIVKKFYENNLDASGAARELVDKSLKRWRKNENNVDDITVIVAFFES